MKSQILRVSTLLSFFNFFLVLSLHSQHANDILGTWLSEEGRSHILIFKSHPDVYSGKIIWLKEPNNKNGKPKLADNGKPVMDMTIMTKFIFEEGRWTDGEIYDPESGKTYYAEMELLNNGNLKLRGSVDPMGWIGRSQVWIRVK